jgi:hypothetical protein
LRHVRPLLRLTSSPTVSPWPACLRACPPSRVQTWDLLICMHAPRSPDSPWLSISSELSSSTRIPLSAKRGPRRSIAPTLGKPCIEPITERGSSRQALPSQHCSQQGHAIAPIVQQREIWRGHACLPHARLRSERHAAVPAQDLPLLRQEGDECTRDLASHRRQCPTRRRSQAQPCPASSQAPQEPRRSPCTRRPSSSA